MDPFNSRLLDLSSLQFLKANTDKPQLGCPGISSVDKTKGGCARAPVAYSMPPGPSPPSLPQAVASFSTSPPPLPNVPAVVAELFWSFRMLLIPPSSYRQLSMMCSTTSRQLGRRWPPDFAAWKEPSFRQPEQNMTASRFRLAPSGLPALGPLLSTWCPRRTDPGGHAATSGG